MLMILMTDEWQIKTNPAGFYKSAGLIMMALFLKWASRAQIKTHVPNLGTLQLFDFCVKSLKSGV